ncbi:MAG TPA: DinB family protein [Thermoanaerobaculia bacterium]
MSNTNAPDKSLRDHLVSVLDSSHAHADFAATVGGVPEALRGVRPQGLPYSLWELLEHLRLAQWDILEFSRDPKHVSPKWPEEYWPKSPEPPDAAAWEQSIATFRRDLQAMRELVADPQSDLHAAFPHGDGQTLLREALLVADHNAYHLGQMVLVRRLLGCWPV